ncbi:MAG: DUF2294 domain-containing protein [Cyanobacteria bacterium P01_G01_bin.49]
MSKKSPTCGQLERDLSQQIQAFYREQLGHQPSKIICQLFEQKLVIIIENSITSAEQLLAQEGQDELAQEVRSSLEEVIKPKIRQLIETILNVGVVDLLSDANLETGRTGIIAVLTDTPQVRNLEAIAKVSSPRSPSANSK